MADVKWSAYGSADTLITGSDLNSLASGSWATGVDTPIDNGTDLKLYMDVELVLASGVTAGSGTPRVDVYIIPIPDGTNPPTPPGTSAAAAPAHYFVGSIMANASASFTRGVLRKVEIPPGEFGVLIQSQLGVAMPASGNTLVGYRYGEQVA